MAFKKFLVGLVLVFLVQGSALAAEQYYLEQKIKGYDKGDFVVLDADDINFREQPVDGRVLKVLPHHSLLRVLAVDGDWLQAESDGVTGYIYAPFTSKGAKDELTQEDFAVGYAVLGEHFEEKQAEAKLGAVQKTLTNKKLKRTDYVYATVTLGVTKKLLTSIKVTDPKYITMRGVSVGDSAGRAVGQYGVPDAVVYAKDVTTYEYLLPEDKKQQLRFALEIDAQSRVQAFVLERVEQK